jgi:Tfp pilus assembly protein PilO
VVLSKRERYVFMGVLVVLGILLLDSFVIGPAFAYRAGIVSDVEKAEQEIADNRRVVKLRGQAEKLWSQMTTQNGLKSDASAAEEQLMVSLEQWVRESGLESQNFKKENPAEIGKFQAARGSITATGRMKGVAQFLWRVETAPIPLKITSLQVTPRKDGVDDLSLNISVSTLYVPPEAEKPKPGARPAGTGTRS